MNQWCVSSSIMNQSSMNDESSLINPLSFPLDCQRINCGSFVLVERWRTAAFSQFCLQIALPYKKGIHKLIASWPSFIAHRTTDNAVSVSLATLGRFCRSDYLYHDHGRLSYRICTRSASRKTRPSNGLHNRQWCGIVVFNDCLQLKSYLCSIVSSGIKNRA